jgi:hypothetical protein
MPVTYEGGRPGFEDCEVEDEPMRRFDRRTSARRGLRINMDPLCLGRPSECARRVCLAQSGKRP